jgi:glycosyltransferase involved in cell wall biosynthesis
MRILYVVQRYGEEIVGGSEAACRSYAEELAKHGHDVEVLTSCAHSYVTWANHYPAGSQLLNGVTVHRLPVAGERLPHRFGPMDQFLMSGRGRPTWFQNRHWAKLMGPDMPELAQWLTRNIERFDVAVFMTYLYATTTVGIFAAAGRIPTVLQPTAHDEPPLRISLFQSVFRQPDAFLFFTPEEREVVQSKFLVEPVGSVAGMGITLEPEISEESEFRSRFSLENDQYVVYIGRLDPMKGVREMCSFFIEYKKRNPSRLKLVLAGEELVDLPRSDDIVITGYLSEPDKQRAIASSLALIQPSYFESFSIVLCEAWVQRRPALVQAASPVLKGQAMRSNGAIPYRGFAEFEAALDLLASDSGLREEMGCNGRRYVEANYDWNTVIKKFELAAELARTRFEGRPVKLNSRN